MGNLCARKGCGRKKSYGLFCFVHKVERPLVDPRPSCAAHFCNQPRLNCSMFCGQHQRAMDRDSLSAPAFRAPLPDLKCKFVIDSKKSACPNKLRVKWNSSAREFIATHPNTNVTGSGESPGEAVRNWQSRWNFPY